MKFASSSFAAKLAVSLLMSSVLLGALVISASTPEAAGVRTKLACISDYRSYCSSYKMGSNELRQCMNANGPKLSRKCVKALVADGEISEAEVARRAADGR